LLIFLIENGHDTKTDKWDNLVQCEKFGLVEKILVLISIPEILPNAYSGPKNHFHTFLEAKGKNE
jgi:hypothetical protein